MRKVIQNVRGSPPPGHGLSPAGYRGREGLAVGAALAVVGDGTGVGASVFAGDGTAAVAPGATAASESHPDGPAGLGSGVAFRPVGAGTGVAFPPVGVGTGVARQGAEVGTAVGAAPAGLATGAEARRPLPAAAVGATVPAVAVTAPLGVPLAASAVGWLGPVLAELAGADAAEPEPDADAEHPARARPAAIPSVQPAAARADLLCDRTCMLLEVVPVKTRTPGNTPGRGESCARRAATFLPVRPYMDKRGRSGARRRPVAVRPGDGGRPRSARPGRPAERTE